MYDVINTIDLDLAQDAIIKVMGVGGGGCNAVNYLYSQGIKDVTFLVCNTDKQALGRSSVPAKLQLGPGLGAGGKPEVAQQYAEENRDRIHEALNDGTKMLFLTAGMGGGTGTGASAIVAEVAKEMDILTVGIVTIPFAFEGKKKIRKAMIGVAQLAEQVDAILVINNEKLRQIYPDLNMLNAFSKSDDVVANAARAVAEIITVPGYINTDFADVYNTLKNGNVAIMSVGTASGENRITQAIHEALHSPLVNSDVKGASRVLLQIYCSQEHAVIMEENDQIYQFIQEVGEDVEVQWGISVDDTLGENVRVTIIATGYEVSDIPGINEAVGTKSIEEAIADYYKDSKQPAQPAQEQQPEPEPQPVETPVAEPSHPAGQDGNEINITLDDTQAPSPQGSTRPEPARPAPATHPAQSASHDSGSFFRGWMRGRK